jgi:hypothetical protein
LIIDETEVEEVADLQDFFVRRFSMDLDLDL